MRVKWELMYENELLVALYRCMLCMVCLHQNVGKREEFSNQAADECISLMERRKHRSVKSYLCMF